MKIEPKKEAAEGFGFETEKRTSVLMRYSAGGDKELFIENLSLLLASGMDTISALDALQKEAKSRGMKAIIGQMESSIAGGTTLSLALERTGLFGANVVSLIRIGEQTGKLSENLRVVAASLQKEKTFRSKIASAMMYPVFVLSLTLIIGVSISWVILPRLASVFGSLHIQLPWVTQFLIDLGIFLGRYGVIFVPSFIAAVLLIIYFVFVFPKTKFIGQELLFSFPGAAELMGEVELARFGFVLGNLLAAGLPIVTAFDALIEVTTFRSYKKLYRHLRDRIEEGNSFQKSFSGYDGVDRLVPPSIQQMIVAAEQSGYLSDSLIKIGERFEEKTDITTKNLSTILEPILLVVVWFGVAGVALAIILPIYSLIGGFTQSAVPVLPAPTEAVTSAPMEALTPTPTASQLGGQATPAKRLRVQTISIGYLNIRQGPSTTASILSRALPGDELTFSLKQGDWYQIIFDGGAVGWVNAAYVQELP